MVTKKTSTKSVIGPGGTVVRISQEHHAQLTLVASKNKRSLQGEMAARLEQSFRLDEIEEHSLKSRVEEIERKVGKMWRAMELTLRQMPD